MLFDRDEFLKQCEVAAKAVKYARRWWASRDGESLTLLNDKLDSLNISNLGRNHFYRSKELRAEFLEDNPHLKDPLKDFEDAVGSFYPSWWKAANPHPSFPGEPDPKALEKAARALEEAVATLSAALGGNSTAMPVACDRVTLAQAAGIVHRAKRTLEHYKTKGLPLPTVEGGGGRPDLWDWEVIRPWLEKEFRIDLSMYETFPASRRS
jgi:hypothetical protein